jgi:radical SAM superfamily enzyme YgiQ (UPF0313 family)
MTHEKIILLNPPSYRYTFSRDYYCSKVLKGKYVEHPVDLLYASGLLSDAGYTVSVIDATVEGISSDELCCRILREKPDTIFFIAGSVSWDNDRECLIRIKKKMPEIRFIGSGDLFFRREVFMENPWIDAVIYDFTSPEILLYVRGTESLLTTVAYRKNGEIVWPQTKVNVSRQFLVSIPRHDLFLHLPYSFPFVRHLPFTTVLTDYGCSYTCSFCVYNKIGYKERSIENVEEELRSIEKLGIREIFFKDQTFGNTPERIKALSLLLETFEPRFSWTAFMRVDLVTEELLMRMKRAGCHTLIFGVESSNESLLECYSKGFYPDQVLKAFRLCKEKGIDTVATFIIGFPNETRESVEATLRYACELDPEYASFNLYIDKKRKPEEGSILDQSGIMVPCGISQSEKERVSLRSYAQRRFYLRPRYLIKQISRVRSWLHLKNAMVSGIEVIKQSVRITYLSFFFILSLICVVVYAQDSATIERDKVISEAQRAMENKDLAFARTLYMSILEKSPHDVDIVRTLAGIAWEENDLDTAIIYYVKALSLEPYDISALKALSSLSVEKAERAPNLRERLRAFHMARIYYSLGLLIDETDTELLLKSLHVESELNLSERTATYVKHIFDDNEKALYGMVYISLPIRSGISTAQKVSKERTQKKDAKGETCAETAIVFTENKSRVLVTALFWDPMRQGSFEALYGRARSEINCVDAMKRTLFQKAVFKDYYVQVNDPIERNRHLFFTENKHELIPTIVSKIVDRWCVYIMYAGLHDGFLYLLIIGCVVACIIVDNERDAIRGSR